MLKKKKQNKTRLTWNKVGKSLCRANLNPPTAFLHSNLQASTGKKWPPSSRCGQIGFSCYNSFTLSVENTF
jgi:hypothetical protein